MPRRKNSSIVIKKTVKRGAKPAKLNESVDEISNEEISPKQVKIKIIGNEF
jgi:hypothetical protein